MKKNNTNGKNNSMYIVHNMFHSFIFGYEKKKLNVYYTAAAGEKIVIYYCTFQ